MSAVPALALASLQDGELFARLVLAVLLGGILGLEREYRSKPAGLRTHMLVALGAASFSLAALAMVDESRRLLETPGISASFDPTRVVDGIVGGIGFLGAGAIIPNRRSVEGLTTAGSIWLVGAVGIAVGAGAYVLACSSVLLAVLILLGLRFLERWTRRRMRHPV